MLNLISMKNNLILIPLLFLLLFSCKKTEDAETEKPKTIGILYLVPEKLLFRITDTIKFNVRYSKSYNYNDAIKFKFGSRVIPPSKYYVNELEGINYSYKISPPHTTGDVLGMLEIINNQNTTVRKKNIRIITDFQLENIWGSLDKDYVINTLSLAEQPFASFIDLKEYSFSPLINMSFEGIDIRKPLPKFIDGFAGLHKLIYDDKNVLKKITIVEDIFYDQNMTETKFFDNLIKIYGPIISVTDNRGIIVTHFERNKFNIDVNYYNRLYTTEITLK